MELLSIGVFFPVFGERLKIFFFALDTNFICEYEKVYLLNWTENSPMVVLFLQNSQTIYEHFKSV